MWRGMGLVMVAHGGAIGGLERKDLATAVASSLGVGVL